MKLIKHEPVAVIVPAYNAESFLKRCVDSILLQTYQELEIWLIDDGSTDSTPDICDAYSEQEPRIQVVHQENRGLSGARNTGLDRMKADYVFFIDADDEITPDAIETLWNTLHEHEADISVCSYRDIYPEDPRKSARAARVKGSGQVRIFQGDDRFDLIWQDWIVACAQWNKLFRKKIFQKLRFPEGKYHEDEFVIHRELGEAESIAWIDRPLYLYYRHDYGITGNRSWEKLLHSCEAFRDRTFYFLEADLAEQVVRSRERFLRMCYWAEQWGKKRADAAEWMPQIDRLRMEVIERTEEYFQNFPDDLKRTIKRRDRWGAVKAFLYHAIYRPHSECAGHNKRRKDHE